MDFTRIWLNYSDTVLSGIMGQQRLSRFKHELKSAGISFDDLLSDHTLLETELRAYYGNAAPGIVSKLSAKTSIFKEFGKISNTSFTKITHPKLINIIFDSYGNNQKKEILKYFIKPTTRKAVLEKIGIPQTSTYRKIQQLIDDGVLIYRGKTRRPQGGDVLLYSAWFSLSISIDRGITHTSLKLFDDLDYHLIVRA